MASLRLLAYRLFFIQLITLFVNAGLLNTNEVKGDQILVGERIITPPTTNSTVSNATFHSPLTTMRSFKEEDLALYLDEFTGPFEEKNLEFALDYNQQNAMKVYDFDPIVLMKQLINLAVSQEITPVQLQKDIYDLINLQNCCRMKEEAEESSTNRSSTMNEMSTKNINFHRALTLQQLETKYHVTSEVISPHSVTASRLALMFPHFINFGQRPFENPLEIPLPRLYNTFIPSYFARPEFAGVIPRIGLDNTTMRLITGVHLYALHTKDEDNTMPVRTKCVIVRKRMERSILSDARRMRLLRNNDILTQSGKLLKTKLIFAYKGISSDFMEKVDWEIMGVAPETDA